jgi:hypothetical protein
MTDIFFILDESASMWKYSKQYIVGINNIINEQKRILHGTDSTVSLIKFSSVVTPVFITEKLATIRPIVNGSDYEPAGNTSLFDAVYNTFKFMPVLKRNTVIIILTDGVDNYSEMTLGDTKSIIKSHECDKLKLIYVSPTDVSDSIGLLLGIKTRVIFSESEKSIDMCMKIINMNIKKTYMDVNVDLPTNVSDQYLDDIISRMDVLHV